MVVMTKIYYIFQHIIYNDINEEENEKDNNIYPISGGIKSNTDKKSLLYLGSLYNIYNIPLIITKNKKI